MFKKVNPPLCLASQEAASFEARFINLKRPVIVRGGAASFSTRTSFAKKFLLQQLSQVRVESSNIPYKSR